ncbi:MAG: ABC transporter permease [Acidimicrobiia bacterium]
MSALVVRALERELIIYARTWRGYAFSSFVQPLLFLGAMGIGLGGLVEQGAEGLEYVVFVTPGLLAASALMTAGAESLWPVMGGVKWMGQYNSMVTTAMTPGDVYGGLVLAAAVRALVASVAFLAVAVPLGGTASWWAPLAVVPAVLLASTTTAVLAAFSVTRQSDTSFALVMRLGVIPLFLFSGTFFPVEQLPDALRPVVWLSPLWHAVEPARDLTTGTVDVTTPLHLVVLLAVTAVALPFGVRNFARRLTP